MPNGSSPPLVSTTGLTRDGQPLAYSRTPAADLAPWVQSLATVDIAAGEGVRRCGIFSANPAIRVLLSGKWRFETAEGVRECDTASGPHSCYFGPQTVEMPVEVEGPIRFLLVQFHPGAPPWDQSQSHESTLDTVINFQDQLPPEIRNVPYETEESREEWLDRFEGLVRRILFSRVNDEPPEMTLAIYRQVLTRPNLDLDAIADDFGVSRRTVERHVRKHFGVSAKRVARRARALDMAAALLGVAMPEEEPKFRLRYFDQSHMTREIQAYFGTSPGALSRQEAMLLRIDLEIRQIRRLELMGELNVRNPPWRDPAAEPGSETRP